MVKHLSPGKKAQRTGKYAKIMTKWRITYKTRGVKWQFVSFEGSQGGESTGVVDLIAIRKNHELPKKEPFSRGDLFDIVMIQVKSGKSGLKISDIFRLKKVARRYKAKPVIAEWDQGKSLMFYGLSGNKLDPEKIF